MVAHPGHYHDWLFWLTISNNLKDGELDDISTFMDPSTIPFLADFSFLGRTEYCKIDVALNTKKSFSTEIELLSGMLTELRSSKNLQELEFNVVKLSTPGVCGLVKSIEIFASIEDLGVEVWKEFGMQSKASKAMYLEIGSRAVEILNRGSKKDLAVVGEGDDF